MTQFRVELVEDMPGLLETSILYVSEIHETAAHLCACGCRSKIRTPLGPTEWSFWMGPNGPSLSPSIGNWQRPCQSHYFINDGAIEWAPKWSPAQVEAGRALEHQRRDRYYRELYRRPWLVRVWERLKDLFR